MAGNRTIVILLAVLVVAVLGLHGLYQLEPAGFLPQFDDHLYRVVQLFTAEGDWSLSRQLPWSLQIARFLAPVVTVVSLALLFAERIWLALINFRVRFFRRHIVIAGLSEAALVLVRDCMREGVAVVVLEADRNHRLLPQIHRWRIPIFHGDVRSEYLLRRVRTQHAKALISFLASDDDAVELALRLRNVVQRDSVADTSGTLKVLLQISDLSLAARLQEYGKFHDSDGRLEVRFFHADELAARRLFLQYRPDVYADALGAQRVHIVVFGFTGLGQRVLMSALRRAHYATEELLKVTVIAPAQSAQEVQGHRDWFAAACPGMDVAAEVTFTGMPTGSVMPHTFVDESGIVDATMLVSCVGSDADNLALALMLRREGLLARIPNAPILVALRSSRGISQLVESSEGGPEIPDGLFPFGNIEELMTVRTLVDEETDSLAVALHEFYVAQFGGDGITGWTSLDERMRDENRYQADHIAAKLRAIGCATGRRDEQFALADGEVEALAAMEKQRWNAARTAAGWQFDAQRSDFALRHPGIKQWQACSPQERIADQEIIRQLPQLLLHNDGPGLSRIITVGVTGHRLARIENQVEEVTEQIVAAFEDLKQQYGNVQFVLMTALADGSDRLVGRLAVTHLHASLFAVLPLPYEIYRRTFGYGADGFDADRNALLDAEFQELIGQCHEYVEMPLRFGGVDVLERDDDAGTTARNHQYALAGAYIVNRCDELIAVWDGAPAQGLGGTGAVAAWRNDGEVPQQYHFPDTFFKPVSQRNAIVVSVD